MQDRKQLNKEHNRRVKKFVSMIEKIFEVSNQEAIKMAESIDYDPSKMFKFADYPELKTKVNKFVKEFQKQIKATIVNGITAEWGESNFNNNELVQLMLRNNLKMNKAYFNNHEKALQAFIDRKTKGMDLSERVWRLSKQYKENLEQALSVGLSDGKSAADLSRDIREYLNEPKKLFRRVRDLEGKLQLSKNAKEYNPGNGVYRSSFKNALRLTRTEINMAYRKADSLRWKDFDFVIGIEIKLSDNHTLINPKTGKAEPFYDICDELQGKYPKTFVFTGWHPNCYDEETEVLTKRGWQYFKYITKEDKIFSLNPETKETEWVEILLYFKRLYNGEMVHFYNRNLDCLVTPEHEMVYLNKYNQEIKRCKAIDFTMGKGAFFRGCKNNNNPIKTININGLTINFNLFCEFMGYWLSDGSTIRKSQICIAQQDDNRINIINCIEQIGFKVSFNKDKINFYSNEFCSYLKQFKTAYHKYIPYEIKQSSKEQIKIFLNAFISCDGYIKKPKSFIGNRGNIFIPKNEERMYFTTSPQMASDLGELILKIGKRPSYRINKNKNKIVSFKNGDYKLNYDLIVISECQSLTATQFNKKLIDYHGYVYDVTLSKNAIMYIRRNGKCFWGSNCRCFAIPILKSREEFFDKTKSSREVKEIPQNFKEWIKKNEERIINSKSVPYFIADNTKEVPELYIALSKKHESSFTARIQRLVQGLDVHVTPTNLKSDNRILQKAHNDYNDNIYDVKDIVRTTIVAEQSLIDTILKNVNEEFNIYRHKEQFFKESGYSGHIFNIKTSNGTFAEIQVNTPQMIYGKEKDAKLIIGEELFNAIKSKSGLEHGLCHSLYEKVRTLNDDTDNELIDELNKLQRDYYNALKRINI